MRSTYAEIDLDAITRNVAAFQELIAPSRVCAVVKADGYGHGDAPVAAATVDAGASLLAVALVEEGARLREAGVEADIVLLSEPTPSSAADVVRWDLQPTVYSKAFADALAAAGAKQPIHVMVDTGMHRVGARPKDVKSLIAHIRSLGLDIGWLSTHFAVADEDRAFTHTQIELFDETASEFDVQGAHLANTAGAVLYPEARRDFCRIGLGIYGLHPCDETRSEIHLSPAMRVVSHVSHVQRLKAGERPSYGRVRSLKREATVVTVPIGYADGYARLLTTSGVVLIGGQRFPLAGTVTMDQIVVDVGDEDVDIGEEVVVLGAQADDVVTADEWAGALGTISYEVVCSIGPRVPRRYV